MLTEETSPTQHLEGQEEAFKTTEMRPETSLNAINGVTADRLRGFIERIERLEEEKKGITDDIKEIYAESKALGFNTKIMRKIVSLRKLEQQDRMELEELIDVYKHALGMV
ncbi:DUF2312 domain-containing protein [Kiloniella majae]|uniref:DUF2312 domain-containing protein n=1 Tax=Kiloniella majae TaxID=1938558 RepID=UPI0030B7FF25